jgi:hypothetical protein
LGEELSLELPDLLTLWRVDHVRGAVLEIGRKPSLEGVRGLHDVVIDRDDGVLHVPGLRLWEENLLG